MTSDPTHWPKLCVAGDPDPSAKGVEVALFEPRIPQNTGSIARTCAATNTPLHIVGPPTFEISDRTVRRAGLDYWDQVRLFRHESWSSFTASREAARIWLLTAHASRPYFDVSFEPGDVLAFGNEEQGLGTKILSGYPNDQHLLIPMQNEKVRCLNLSNAVSIVLFEALRQLTPKRAAACEA